MTGRAGPRAFLRGAARIALLLAGGIALPAGAEPGAGSFCVTAAGGSVLAALPLPEGAEICLRWSHSVTGGAVADCFVARRGDLVLSRSYLHDFAAGLGEVHGRGRIGAAEGGGYWIEDIDEVVPGGAYVLRPGGPEVDHRLRVGDRVVSLSAVAPRARVRIALTRH